MRYSNKDVTPAERANLPRYSGQAPFYEVWFAEVQDAARDSALWLRYTLAAPSSVPPIAEVWGMYFDRRVPVRSQALKTTVQLEQAHIARDRLHLTIAGAELTHYGCRGELSHGAQRLSWDLSWSEDRLLEHYPFAAMYNGALPRTKVLSPHWDLRASGRYGTTDQQFSLEAVPGVQSHIWGTEHARRWIWCHASGFREDPGAIFEGLSAEVAVGPFAAPPLTLFALHWRGRTFLFNTPRDLLRRNESRTDAKLGSQRYHPIARWTVGGGDDTVRFRGEIWAQPEHYLGVKYQDPRGGERFCNHSRLANAALEIMEPDKSGGWRVTAQLTTDGGAALEMGGLDPDPHVEVRV